MLDLPVPYSWVAAAGKHLQLCHGCALRLEQRPAEGVCQPQREGRMTAWAHMRGVGHTLACVQVQEQSYQQK